MGPHRMKMTTRVVLACVASIAVAGGVTVASGASGSPERPVFGTDPGEGGEKPLYVAVSDGRGGIAGYAELALMDGSATPASSPAAAAKDHAAGTIVPVFDRDARLVGYFASQEVDIEEAQTTAPASALAPPADPSEKTGFVDERGKDALLGAGWVLLQGTAPTPEG